MLDGLFNGLSSIGSKIGKWGAGFIDGVCDFFGIHSPSTEFESLGKYMMLGMEGGIDDNSSIVLAVFSTLLERMLAATQSATNDMQALFVLFLLYLIGDFKNNWTNAWEYFHSSSRQKIQSIMREIDALNAKLASIERNISITITTTQRTINSSISSVSKNNTSRSVAPRIAAMPAVLNGVPALARGAVIPPNREFMAILGDQKSGTNIETPESLLRQIVKEESGNSTSDYLLREILAAIREGKVLVVGKKQLGEVVSQALSNQARSRGAAAIPL